MKNIYFLIIIIFIGCEEENSTSSNKDNIEEVDIQISEDIQSDEPEA